MAAFLAPEAPEGTPELVQEDESGRFADTLHPPRAALGGSRSSGPGGRCDADGNQQEKDRRTAERTGHHGGSLESALPRPGWPRRLLFGEK